MSNEPRVVAAIRRGAVVEAASPVAEAVVASANSLQEWPAGHSFLFSTR